MIQVNHFHVFVAQFWALKKLVVNAKKTSAGNVHSALAFQKQELEANILAFGQEGVKAIGTIDAVSFFELGR